MQLDHEFTVPVPADQAWLVLLDIARIAPCLPGAVIDTVTDEGFAGRVKVKVGPINISYAGHGTFVEKDQAAGRVLIDAAGKETRGSGTAKASIAAQLHDDGASTRVTVQTDLAITGKPAQFGRGVMVDVGNKLLGQFADCLAQRLSEAPEDTSDAAASSLDAPATEEAESGPSDAAASSLDAPAAESPAPPVEPAVLAASPAAPPAPTAVRPAVVTSSPLVAPPAGSPTDAPPSAAATFEPEAINLLGVAGGPVLKRMAPVVVAVLLAVLAWIRASRRRRTRLIVR